MTDLGSLFERYKSLCEQKAEIVGQMKALEREIQALTIATAPLPVSFPPRGVAARKKPQRRGVTQEMATTTLAAIRAVGVGQPVLRRDLARQLGITDFACNYRLRRLQDVGYVQRVGDDRYRVVEEVPDL